MSSFVDLARDKPVAAPLPSSTLVVMRERARRLEVLLLRRSAALAVHGGGWVFPGGKLEPGDGDAGDALAALRGAACREAREEAGIELSPARVVGWSRWITPVGRKPRFDTWFFATAVDAETAVVVDGGEIDAFEWLSPRDALDACETSRMELMPPTRLTLLDVELTHRESGSLAAMLDAVAGRELYPITPIIVKPGEHYVSLYPWDVDYAAAAGPAYASPGPVPAYLQRLPSRIVFR